MLPDYNMTSPMICVTNILEDSDKGKDLVKTLPEGTTFIFGVMSFNFRGSVIGDHILLLPKSEPLLKFKVTDE